MAIEDRIFTLVGKFEDGISPNLKKINSELTSLMKTFGKLDNSLKPVSKRFSELAKSSDTVSTSFAKQRNSMEMSIRAMETFAKNAGKVVAANKAMEKSALEAQRATRSAGAGGISGVPGGGVPGGGGMRSAAAIAGGVVAGQQISNVITGAIVKGFQLGVGIMQKPFQYAINAFGERMQDELSDIQSAGAMFAIDKRDRMGVFKGFEDAREFQKDLNVRLAQSAAALPGATEDYVKQAKQLTDNMMLAYSKNKKSFLEFAKTLGPVSGERDALGLVLQKFTEKSVLLGMGQGGSSMYGVPQILAMLLDQDKVNVNAFRRFAAYQANPLLKNALERAQPELAKTVKGSSERLKLIQKVLDEAVPNDVVMALKNSLSGVKEAIRSGFLDPEAGLFGLGRALNLGIPKVDALGRYLDENGKVVATAAEAAKTSASLFDLLRDSLGGFVLPLSELVSILPQIFDPLQGIGKQMVSFRNLSQNFFRNFNQYVADFEGLSKDLGGAAGGKIKASAGARGALLAFSDLLVQFGAFKESDFTRVSTQLQRPDANLGGIGKEIFSTLFSSDFMKEVGKVIGSVVGSTLKMVGDTLAGVTDMAQAGPFAKGLKEGWDSAQGAVGVREIFQSLFKILGTAIVEAFKAAPIEMGIATTFTLGMPIITGLITAGITQLIGGIFSAGLINAVRMRALGALSSLAVRFAVATTPASAVGAGLAGAGAAGAGAAGAEAAGAGAAGAGAAAVAAAPVALGAAAAAAIIWQRQFLEFAQWLADMGQKLSQSKNFAAAGFAVLLQGLGALVEGLTRIINGAFNLILGLVTGNIPKIQQGFNDLMMGVVKTIGGLVVSVIGIVTSLGGLIIESVKNLFIAIWNGVRGIKAEPNENKPPDKGYRTRWNAVTRTTERLTDDGWKPVGRSAEGSLGDAISYEMKHKPSGSKLVIANSSETIIPAAGGLGMRDFMETLTTGFSAVKQLFRDTQAETRLKFQAVNTLLDRSRQETSTNFRGVNSRFDRSSQEARQNQTQNNSRFTAIDKRLEKLTSGGLFGSGGPGNIIGVGKALLGMGLQVGMNPYFEYGKGFLPGGGGYIGKHTPGSYHYLGRALDVSGPPGLLDVAYQRLKATNPTELLWRVKDHYDHLHVAYAYGQGMPAFFSSRKDAVDWERKATLGNVRVSSITANSSEGFGGGVTVNAPITINQQPGQNAEHLAALVAMELSNAINQARSSSLYT